MVTHINKQGENMNFDNVHSITFKTLGGKSTATYTALFGGSVDGLVKVSDDFSDNSVLWSKKEVIDNFIEPHPSWVIKGIEFKRPTLYSTDNEKEKAMSTESTLNITQDIYFDVAKHAEAWGVKHEEASDIIQKELFKAGYDWSWPVGGAKHKEKELIHVETDTSGKYVISHGAFEYIKNADNPPAEATLQASTTYTLHIEQPEPEEEIVEFSGKKYSKADIEKALALLQPKEEV
jgi:hypothetical protein